MLASPYSSNQGNIDVHLREGQFDLTLVMLSNILKAFLTKRGS